MTLPRNVLPATRPSLLTKEITDLFARNNFQQLTDYFRDENQLLGFKFFELEFTQSVSNTKVSHGLGVVPQDVIVTKIVGTGSVSFNFGLFDRDNLDITATGSVRVRFFVGFYWNTKSNLPSLSSDVETFGATSGSTSSLVTQVEVPLTATQVREQLSPGSTASLYVVRALVDSFIFANGPVGFQVQLPLASDCVDQLIHVQNTNADDNDVEIVLDPKDAFAYIDEEGTLTHTLASFGDSVKLLSQGEFFRIVT